nr:hypothetical protein [Mesorhizobium sp. B4-1-3]
MSATARNSGKVEDFVRDFSARIVSLADTHFMLTERLPCRSCWRENFATTIRGTLRALRSRGQKWPLSRI